MTPATYTWETVDIADESDGVVHSLEAFVPRPRFRERCRRENIRGGVYILTAHEERSKNSHDSYFAELDEKFDTLPENLHREYPNREIMRAKALCHTGYCDQKDTIFDTETIAQTVATFMTPLLPYSVIQVSGCVIRLFTPHSQAVAAMDKAQFQKSKRDVLDWIDRELLGIGRQTEAAE